MTVDKKSTFLDYLPPFSFKRSLWTTPKQMQAVIHKFETLNFNVNHYLKNTLELYILFKNCRKNTGSKSRYFFIYQNRISNKLRTKNINVIGSCCWKICPRIGFGRCQALKPGDKKKPNVSYISRIQAYNC